MFVVDMLLFLIKVWFLLVGCGGGLLGDCGVIVVVYWMD